MPDVTNSSWSIFSSAAARAFFNLRTSEFASSALLHARPASCSTSHDTWTQSVLARDHRHVLDRRDLITRVANRPQSGLSWCLVIGASGSPGESREPGIRFRPLAR
jgi:hypothetical protein